MKTKYEEIVSVNHIGKQENPIQMNEILKMASDEQLDPAGKDKERVLMLCIDVQQDFMDNGALGVPGAYGDVERLTRFVYNNMDKISKIAASIDTHIPHQIFHPCWWVDENGNNPAPYTQITLADLDSGKWKAVINPITSRDYVEHLEADGKKTLCVWSYHCIQGTTGCALDNQFSNMVYFHSVARKTVPLRIVKGQDPLSEMYGIIKPEYDRNNYINMNLLNEIEKYDKVIIAGEARDYCVYESLLQILDFYKDNTSVLNKIYVLEDCMSSIGDPNDVDKMYADLQNKHKFNIVKSTDDILA